MAGSGKRWSAGDFSIVRLMSNDREMTGGDTVAGRRSAAEGKGVAWDWGTGEAQILWTVNMP